MRNNVESSITLCFWSLFPLFLPSYLCTYISPGQRKKRAGRTTRNHWPQRAVLHVYLGRLDHLNCPLECSPVWKWISLWRPALACARDFTIQWLVCFEFQAQNWLPLHSSPTLKCYELNGKGGVDYWDVWLTLFFLVIHRSETHFIQMYPIYNSKYTLEVGGYNNWRHR